MEDFENKKSSGELDGFDSVDNKNDGYTVTPEGGFYTRKKEDIIQDNFIGNTDTSSNDFNKQTDFYSSSNQNQDPYVGVNSSFNGYYYPPRKVPKAPKEPKEKKRFGAGMVVLCSILAAFIGASGGIGVVYTYGKNTAINSPSTYQSDTTPQNVNINIDKTVESVVEAVAEKVIPSVVGIRTTTSVMSFFGGTSESSGDGSGVVYSSDGYIITNYHVISGAVTGAKSKIEVYLDPQSTGMPATVVGYNISNDLAVIKIDAKNLTPIEFADSSKIKVGQYVVTVGNPGGLEFMDSVTYGVISGLDRVFASESDVKLIQTDAAINPGNSGGALVDTRGRLVGINSSKIVSEQFEGMGFAIPSNTVKEVCERIIARENAPEPYIGIRVSEKYTADVLTFYGYPAGAVVLTVDASSPAEVAGIKRGDIITEYNGKRIKEYNMLGEYVMDSDPGDKVTIKLYRSGRYYTTTITIGSNNAAR
ncbi:MAG: S1C family serine protease [Acutalibacteraceae bacterium]|jgi:serine protease Do